MNGQDDDDVRDVDGPQGPTQSDIERYGSEDYELNANRRNPYPGFIWRLVAGVAFVAFAIALLLNVLLPALSNRSNTSDVPERIPALVTAVIDARTIRVEVDGEERVVRYIGVRTPITGEPFHEVATESNRQWTQGREVLLEADENDSDVEGRLLRYVWLDGAMINLDLIGVGLASVSEPGRNDRYFSVFQRAEGNAQSAGLGIWSEDERAVSVAKVTSPQP